MVLLNAAEQDTTVVCLVNMWIISATRLTFHTTNPRRSRSGNWRIEKSSAATTCRFLCIADSHSNPSRTAFQLIADSIPVIADSF